MIEHEEASWQAVQLLHASRPAPVEGVTMDGQYIFPYLGACWCKEIL